MSNVSKGQIQLPGEFRPGEPIRAGEMDKLRKAIAFVMKDMIGSGRGITITQSAGKYLISARKQKASASGEKSRLQIVRTAPPSYDPDTDGALTDNDFFVSFGLYNGLIPANIDDKITIAADTHVWLEVEPSATNPAFTTAVAIATGAAAPVNTPPASGEFISNAKIPLGKITDDGGGNWVVQNYGNGSIGGTVYMSVFDVQADGTVEVQYGFSYARF